MLAEEAFTLFWLACCCTIVPTNIYFLSNRVNGESGSRSKPFNLSYRRDWRELSYFHDKRCNNSGSWQNCVC